MFSLSAFIRRAGLLCVAAALSIQLSAASFGAVVLRPVASGFSSPVGFANAGDSRLFIVERGGRIKIIQNGATLATPFLNISGLIVSGGEQGLLGLAFAPDYATSGRFYVYYTRLSDGALRISRFNVSATNANLADSASELNLLTIPHPGQTNHNGGALAFGPDGMLYIATGDGGGGGDPFCNSQNRTARLGKLLRIDVSGSTYTIPPNNPLGPGSTPTEILAIGLRNPWRMSFDPVDGDLYIADVGQNLYEEVNLLPPYAPATSPSAPINYGWPQREGLAAYTTVCPASGITNTDPIVVYDHNEGCSITGGYRYRGARANELTSGSQYVYGDYCNGRIFSATKAANGSWTPALVLDSTLNIASFGEDANRELYVVDINGSIYRLGSTLEPSLDIDLNNSFDAATDGVLLLRYLLGFRGTQLTANAVGTGAQRSNPTDIEAFIAQHLAKFNVDGVAGTIATSDGVLAIRYLLGLPNASLTPNTGATQSATQIRNALDALKP